MESRRKRSRSQMLKWGCYILLLVVCTVVPVSYTHLDVYKRQMFGVRSEADAELTKKTLPALRELYRRERSRVPVEMKIEIEEGGEKLTVTDGTNKAFAYGDAEPQPARTDPTESLSRSLSKTCLLYTSRCV